MVHSRKCFLLLFLCCLFVKGNIPDRRKLSEYNKILNDRNGMKCGLWCDGGTDKKNPRSFVCCYECIRKQVHEVGKVFQTTAVYTG